MLALLIRNNVFFVGYVAEEEIDVEKFINEDVNRIPVKFLRKLVPKLRILCYFSDNQVSGKRKREFWTF